MNSAILMAESRSEAREAKEKLAIMMRRNNVAKRESLQLGNLYIYIYIYFFFCFGLGKTVLQSHG